MTLSGDQLTTLGTKSPFLSVLNSLHVQGSNYEILIAHQWKQLVKRFHTPHAVGPMKKGGQMKGTHEQDSSSGMSCSPYLEQVLNVVFTLLFLFPSQHTESLWTTRIVTQEVLTLS